MIASGGAGELEHLAEALRAGADAALAASIFHYGQFWIAEAKAHLIAAGVSVRAESPRHGAAWADARYRLTCVWQWLCFSTRRSPFTS